MKFFTALLTISTMTSIAFALPVEDEEPEPPVVAIDITQPCNPGAGDANCIDGHCRWGYFTDMNRNCSIERPAVSLDATQKCTMTFNNNNCIEGLCRMHYVADKDGYCWRADCFTSEINLPGCPPRP